MPQRQTNISTSICLRGKYYPDNTNNVKNNRTSMYIKKKKILQVLPQRIKNGTNNNGEIIVIVIPNVINYSSAIRL